MLCISFFFFCILMWLNREVHVHFSNQTQRDLLSQSVQKYWSRKAGLEMKGKLGLHWQHAGIISHCIKKVVVRICSSVEVICRQAWTCTISVSLQTRKCKLKCGFKNGACRNYSNPYLNLGLCQRHLIAISMGDT